MSIEDELRMISEDGFRVNNLFQLKDGSWQANITDGELYFDFARADDPETALMMVRKWRTGGTPAYTVARRSGSSDSATDNMMRELFEDY